MADFNYRHVYGLRHGHLHAALGVKGEIPSDKLDEASDHSNSHIRGMAKVAKKYLKNAEKAAKKA